MFKKNEQLPPKEGLDEKEAFYEVQRLSGVGFWRFLALIVFGTTVFSTVATRFNVYYIAFGVVTCVLLGWLYKQFLRFFLGVINPGIKKAVGKKMIHYAIDNSMLFLIPFAVMSFLATYVLKWTLTTTFLSTAIMSVGTAAAIEVGKLRDKPSMRNTIFASAVAFMFSIGINLGLQYASKVPPYIEALARIIPDVLKGGGLW